MDVEGALSGMSYRGSAETQMESEKDFHSGFEVT